ncbi:MAG: hypothetical protein JWN62_4021 [Acidimicrobiales bacterium]|nr:hypothetical protein [Acidimicrobiales bacterium]
MQVGKKGKKQRPNLLGALKGGPGGLPPGFPDMPFN